MCDNLRLAKELSENKLRQLTEELSTAFTDGGFDKPFLDNVCVYATGSLGRFELSPTSDLDLFFILNSEEPCSNLDMYRFFSKLYDINKKMGFKDPSKRGHYWFFILKKDLLDIGSQDEDYTNGFTARLLLLLESKPIFNEALYNTILTETINAYFKGREKGKDFHPMRLINDIDKYWLTVMQNQVRLMSYSDGTKYDRNWKRMKIGYPRLLTCWSIKACLFKEEITPEYVMSVVKRAPVERLDFVAGLNAEVSQIVTDIKQGYDWFLSLTKETEQWWDEPNNEALGTKNKEEFRELVVRTLMNEMHKKNPDLRHKLDF